MQFDFTPAAARYIQDHGGTVTVQTVIISGCCMPALPPEVRPGPPADPEGFTRHRADGITVYFDTLLAAPPKVTIDLRHYGKLRELVLAP